MVFGTNPILTRELTRRVKDISRRPVIVKLSPNVTDIVELAKAAAEGGADALSVANTYLGMAIDVETFKPRIHTVTGGLSGPAIKPITLRMVYQVTNALTIPVIALGGITTGADAVEYFLAGATAVQVGTANFHDPKAPANVLKQLRRFLERREIPSVRNLIGKLQT
jgi:dihydroorotate dehydrogenase (NAD+) catalytic subunit